MKATLCLIIVLLIAGTGCSNNHIPDASGTFEADEVIVSAEVPGRIMSLNLDEGSVLAKDSIVGLIDSVPLMLQKAQVLATLGALYDKTMDVEPSVRLLKDQMRVQQTQLANAIYEKARTERLIKADAATAKQLDDWNTQIAVLNQQIAVTRQQINVQQNNVGTQNRSVLSESKPLQKSIAQLNDQLRRTRIINPITGTVLAKYAMAGEETAAGKALYKIADISVITLRAYLTGTQLAQIKLNQKVKILADDASDTYRTYHGVVAYIADKAEFTPKTIQTKDERANLVYAVKIRVKNDGYLKIGMYGEVKFE